MQGRTPGGPQFEDLKFSFLFASLILLSAINMSCNINSSFFFKNAVMLYVPWLTRFFLSQEKLSFWTL